MSVYIDTRYRIKRSAQYDSEMKYIVNELKIFQSMAELLVLSAIIGYNNQAYDPFDKLGSDSVLMQFFTQRNYDLMDLMAYAHKKEQSVLKSQDKYTIFESYANGGFPILAKSLKIDFVEKEKNNKIEIIKRLYSLILSNGFKA